MKKYTIDVWYKALRYSTIEVVAESEEEAKRYAQHLEFVGALDYDNDGDIDESGIDMMGETKVTEEEIKQAHPIDKNNVLLVVGDIIKYVGTQSDGAPTILEGKIDSIVYDVGYDGNDITRVSIGGDDLAFLYACDVEKMVTMTTLSDRDYWLQVGDCPKCRLGNTVSPQAGEFVCNKCGWKH